MTRTHKWTVHEARSEPKWFTHHGHANTDPTKTKKCGAGRRNWGQPGDELSDAELRAMGHFLGQSTRRNSNHAQNERDMLTLNAKLDEEMK